MQKYGEVVEVPASGKQSATVIIWHGLTQTADVWVPRVQELDLPYVKWVIPNSPIQKVTWDLGQGSGGELPGWFDMDVCDAARCRQAMDGKRFDVPREDDAMRYIQEVLDKEVASGTPADRVVLMGFSQGGYLSLNVFLRQEQPPAGILALSTWLPQQGLKIASAALQRPVFWGHGTSDPFVPHAIGEESVRGLESAGAQDVTLKLYDGIDHDVSPQELQDIRSFLQRVLPA